MRPLVERVSCEQPWEPAHRRLRKEQRPILDVSTLLSSYVYLNDGVASGRCLIEYIIYLMGLEYNAPFPAAPVLIGVACLPCRMFTECTLSTAQCTLSTAECYVAERTTRKVKMFILSHARVMRECRCECSTSWQKLRTLFNGFMERSRLLTTSAKWQGAPIRPQPGNKKLIACESF